MRKITLIFLVLLLAGCSLPTPAAESPTFTPTFTPSATPTQTNVPYEGCYWNWATQSLPDISKQVQAEVERAGLDGVSMVAEAYGENCIDSRTNQVNHFATMETDFRFTAKVSDLKDTEALGTLLEKML